VTATATLSRIDRTNLRAFVALLGAQVWATRSAEITVQAASGTRAGHALRERQCIEFAIE